MTSTAAALVPQQGGSETKFTPGPWEVSGDGIWAKSPFGARVKIMTLTFSPLNGIHGEANGIVAAAATDMLAVLKLISAHYENQNVNHVDFRVEAKRLADMAIARATGAAS